METKMATLSAQVNNLMEEKDNNLEWHRRIEDDIKKLDEKIDLKVDTITEILVEIKHLRQDHNDLKKIVEANNCTQKDNYNSLKMALGTAIIVSAIGYIINNFFQR